MSRKRLATRGLPRASTLSTSAPDDISLGDTDEDVFFETKAHVHVHPGLQRVKAETKTLRLRDLIDFEKPDDNGAGMYRWLLSGFMLLSFALVIATLLRPDAFPNPGYLVSSAVATFVFSAAGYAGLARIRRFWLFGIPGIASAFLMHAMEIPARNALLVGGLYVVGSVASLLLRGKYSTDKDFRD